jgi:hypothetical protein
MISHNESPSIERLLSVDLENNLTINQESTRRDETEETSEPKMVLFGKQFDITRKQFTVVSLLSMFYLLSNAYYSLLAPFFPSESLKKGINQTQIGIIFGVYELVVLVLSPIFGKYVCVEYFDSSKSLKPKIFN